MQREIHKYLYDIRESIESIDSYLKNKRDFSEYKSDKLLRRGIEREIEIIGEATSRILKIDPNIQIPDSRRIVDLRNWVIHGYDTVDDVIIWGIIINDIPRLKIQVNSLLIK
jgi:uncharacterized protein with HEPN domain